ncbi:snaclec bitiscetin subunit alpha-like [Lithobates pipiens]
MAEQTVYSNVTPTETEGTRERRPKSHRCPAGTKNPDDDKLRLELNRSLETQQNLTQMLEDTRERLTCLRRAILVSDFIRKCPPEWTFVNRKCYFFSTDKKTREDSERFCVENGSVLATVRSKDSILKCHMQSQFWVGLQQRITWTGNVAVTQWFWSDNTTELSLQNTPTTQCVKMGQTLVLSPCTDLLPWICESKPSKSYLLDKANAC